MFRYPTCMLVALAWSCAFSVATAADIKGDIATTDAATAPVIRASTNTVINYTGSTPTNVVGALDTADSIFNRPTNCSTISPTGTAVAFDTITFNNTTAASATVTVRMGPAGNPAAACPIATGPDTFLIAYAGSFNPAAPLANCVLVNDDFPTGQLCSTLSAVPIPAGETRIFVLTAFNSTNQAVGLFPYEVTFAGTTPVALQKFSVE